MEVKINSVSCLLEEEPGFFTKLAPWKYKRTSSKKASVIRTALVLDKVSTTLSPGSITAFLGTGQSHRYLLKMLALRQQEGLVSGKIQYDSVIRKSGIYRDIVLVQDLGITHFGSLTVFDYLFYGVRLRIPHDVIECRERARTACKICGLDATMKIHTLTRTELRILSIAIELSSHPTLIVLLDPVEGLDAYGTLEVLKVLRSVATRTAMPTTIVYNVPTINTDMFPLIDNVSVFMGNRIEYSYSVDTFPDEVVARVAEVVMEISKLLLNIPRCDDMFAISDSTSDKVNSICSSNSSTTELMRLFDTLEDLIHSDSTSTTPTNTTTPTNISDTIIEHGKFKMGLPRLSTTGLHNTHIYSSSRRLDNSLGLPYRAYKPYYTELYVLFMRTMLLNWRNIVTFQLDLFCIALAGVVLGCVAYNQGDKISNTNLVSNSTTELVDVHAYSLSGVVYAIVVLSVVAASFSVYNIHNVVHLIKIESSAGIIRTYTGYLSMLFIDIVVYVLGCIIILSITYNMLDIQGSIGLYYIILVLVTLCSYSLACVCAIWCKSLHTARIVYSIVSIVCLIFAGFLRYIGDLGGVWYVISILSYTRYAYEALTTVVFSDASDRNDYLDMLSFGNSVGMCSMYLIVWIVGLQLISVNGLWTNNGSVKYGSQKQIEKRMDPKGKGGMNIGSSIGSGGSVGGSMVIGASNSKTDNTAAPSHSLSSSFHSARNYTYSSLYHTIASGVSSIGASMGIANPLLDSTEGSMHGGSVHMSTLQGYQPPALPHMQDPEEDETIHFDNINTSNSLFGQDMHIHTHTSGTSGSGSGNGVNVRTAPPIRTVHNTQSYSDSIRAKNETFGATTPTYSKTNTSTNANMLTSPTQRPLLYSTDSSAVNSPVHTPHTLHTLHTSSLSSKRLFDIEYSAESKVCYSDDGDEYEDSEYKADYTPDYDTYTTYSADDNDVEQGGVSNDVENGLTLTASLISNTTNDTTSSTTNYTTSSSTNSNTVINTVNTTITPKLVLLSESLHTTLSFSRVKYVPASTAEGVESRLHSVSYKVEPGSCCCIVDGTGDSSSSTLLLQILAGKLQSSGKASGVISANDQRLGEQQRYLHGVYVPRGDATTTSLHSLTVRQALRYAAYLRRCDHSSVGSVELVRHEWKYGHRSRMPELHFNNNSHSSTAFTTYNSVGRSTDVESRVREVLAMVGLESVADCVIGHPSSAHSTTTRAAIINNTTTSIKLRNMANLPSSGKKSTKRGKSAKNKIKTKSKGKSKYTNISIDGTTHSSIGSSSTSISDDTVHSIPTITHTTNTTQSTSTTTTTSITPAQLRCLTIGMELINRPALVFLDDPLQGLQWHEAQQVASVLQCLALGGRTILLTSDRPTQHTMHYMHDLILLGAGQCVYSGPVKEAAGHFGNIGFERSPHLSDLDFILQVASDRGRMALVGGKRGNALSPEDLADLNRSLNNIKAGREEKKRELILSQQQSSGSSKNISEPTAANNLVNHQPKCIVQTSTVPLLPTAIVLVGRGMRVLWSDTSLLYRTFGTYTTCGVLVGSVWYSLSSGDYHGRISVCATTYMCVSLLLVECIDGIYVRKEAFKRERLSNASSVGAYFLSDAVPMVALNTVACVLFCVPMYFMAGLRSEAGAFLYFTFLTTLAANCNLSLCYLLSTLLPTPVVCKGVYTGVLLPLQLLLSGFVVLVQCMPDWISWSVYLCPMYYYLAGMFRNEFYHNTTALHTIEFSHLSYQYSYYSTSFVCVLALLVVYVAYQLLFLVSLRMFSMHTPHTVRTRVHGAKRKAKKLIKAGLRWRENNKNNYHTTNTTSVHGSNGNIKLDSTHNNTHSVYRTSFNGIMDEDEVSEIEFGNAFYVPQYTDK